MAEQNTTEFQISAAALTEMVAHLPLLPWETDAEGVVTWFGPQWTAYSGRSVQSLLGSGLLEIIHPQDRERLEKAREAAGTNGHSYQVEARLRAADGSYRWFLGRATPVIDPATGEIVRWVGSSIEIDAQKALSAQAAVLETVIRTAPAGIAFFDRDLRYVQINDALAAINGLPREAHLGRTIAEVLPDLPERILDHYRQVLRTGESLVEQEVSGENEFGQKRHYVASYYPVRQPGLDIIPYVGVVVVDVTTQVAARREQAEAYARERTARAEAEASERRLRVVAEVAQALSQPISLEAVLESATEALVGAFADAGSAIWLHDPETRQLRMAASRGYRPEEQRRLAQIGENNGTVAGEAFRRRDVVVFQLNNPTVPAATRRILKKARKRATTIAATPLLVAGRALGTMTLISRGQKLDESWTETLRAVGAQVAAAVERAQGYEQELEISKRLQGALQPALSEETLRTDSGLSIAHKFRSGTEGVTVGGDFYDIWPSGLASDEAGAPRQQLAIVLGDVSGKGLDAAVQTAAIRHAVQAYAYEDPTPVTVMRRLNQLVMALDLLPQGFATLFFATVDAVTGRVDYCSAGHESLLLRRSGGQPVQLLDATAPALGLTASAHAILPGHAFLEPGSELVLYTDGLTEARHPVTRSLLGVDGLADLLAAVQARLDQRGSAAAIASGLLAEVEAYAGGRLEDDAALLVIARPAATALVTATATTSVLGKGGLTRKRAAFACK